MTNLNGKSLKELYKELIINWVRYHNCFDCKEDRGCRDFTVPDWHERYYKFYTQVAEIRLLLKDGYNYNGYKLDSTEDKEFLENLISTDKGDISNSGLSTLSNPNFTAMIGEDEFLEALEDLIKDPTIKNFEAFGDVWRKHNQSRNKAPLRINRVVAACTLEVSSTVDKDKFGEVFEMLQSKNYIGRYHKPPNARNLSEDGKWFDKNQHLMRELRKEFKTELASGKTDSFWLSIFVWELYLHIDKWK